MIKFFLMAITDLKLNKPLKNVEQLELKGSNFCGPSCVVKLLKDSFSVSKKTSISIALTCSLVRCVIFNAHSKQ